MGIKRQYILNIDVEHEDEIPIVEDVLQELLLELYDYALIESIQVIDNNDPINDDDFQELADVLNRIGSNEVMRSIELVREMEEDDDE